jgi:hypothetical protein
VTESTIEHTIRVTCIADGVFKDFLLPPIPCDEISCRTYNFGLGESIGSCGSPGLMRYGNSDSCCCGRCDAEPVNATSNSYSYTGVLACRVGYGCVLDPVQPANVNDRISRQDLGGYRSKLTLTAASPKTGGFTIPATSLQIGIGEPTTPYLITAFTSSLSDATPVFTITAVSTGDQTTSTLPVEMEVIATYNYLDDGSCDYDMVLQYMADGTEFSTETVRRRSRDGYACNAPLTGFTRISAGDDQASTNAANIAFAVVLDTF